VGSNPTPSAKKPRNGLFSLSFLIGCGGYAQSNGQTNGYGLGFLHRLHGRDLRAVPLSSACRQIKTARELPPGGSFRRLVDSLVNSSAEFR
jgi:hypothetical protein